PEMLAEHHLPQMLDAARVFPDQQWRQVLDGPDHAARMPFQGRFAPAEQARLVGLDLDENPVAHPRIADRGLDGGDLHADNSSAPSDASSVPCASEVGP